MQQVAVEDRPIPVIQRPTDAILKVSSTALCGSDLHFYRGHLKCPPDFICGHEFVGEIVEKGDAVKTFKIGDKVCKRGMAGWMAWVQEKQGTGLRQRCIAQPLTPSTGSGTFLHGMRRVLLLRARSSVSLLQRSVLLLHVSAY